MRPPRVEAGTKMQPCNVSRRREGAMQGWRAGLERKQAAGFPCTTPPYSYSGRQAAWLGWGTMNMHTSRTVSDEVRRRKPSQQQTYYILIAHDTSRSHVLRCALFFFLRLQLPVIAEARGEKPLLHCGQWNKGIKGHPYVLPHRSTPHAQRGSGHLVVNHPRLGARQRCIHNKGVCKIEEVAGVNRIAQPTSGWPLPTPPAPHPSTFPRKRLVAGGRRQKSPKPATGERATAVGARGMRSCTPALAHVRSRSPHPLPAGCAGAPTRRARPQPSPAPHAPHPAGVGPVGHLPRRGTWWR